MASITLTNERRDSILRVAVKATFTPRVEAIKQEGNSLAELAYSHIYPADVQKKMDALPSEFFGQTSTIYAYLDMNRDAICLALTSSRKVGVRDREYKRPAYHPEKGSAIFLRIHKHKLDADKLDADKEVFKSELKRFLAGIATMKKLQEVWPEGHEFYAHLLVDNAPKNSLAILPDTINVMINSMKEAK